MLTSSWKLLGCNYMQSCKPLLHSQTSISICCCICRTSDTCIHWLQFSWKSSILDCPQILLLHTFTTQNDVYWHRVMPGRFIYAFLCVHFNGMQAQIRNTSSCIAKGLFWQDIGNSSKRHPNCIYTQQASSNQNDSHLQKPHIAAFVSHAHC